MTINLSDALQGAAAPIPGTGISFAPTGNIAATNVQNAIAELDTEKGDVTLAGAQTLSNKTFTNYTETHYTPSAGSSFTVDLSTGTVQGYTTNANTTVTLPTPAAGKSFQVQIAYGGAHTLTWAVTGGSAIGWPATAPAASAASGKTDVFNFSCNAAGTKWLGNAFVLGATT